MVRRSLSRRAEGGGELGVAEKNGDLKEELVMEEKKRSW